MPRGRVEIPDLHVRFAAFGAPLNAMLIEPVGTVVLVVRLFSVTLLGEKLLLMLSLN